MEWAQEAISKVYPLITQIEQKTSLEAITKKDINLKKIRWLMSQAPADLTMMGMYVLPFLKDISDFKNKDFKFFEKNENSARNLARYFLSETTVEYAKTIFRGLTDLLDNLNSLADRLPEAPPKPPTETKADSMTLIIHGTGAASSEWWQKQGDFFQHINRITGDVYKRDDPFKWSGANDHSKREEAAKNLKEWLDRHPAKLLRIIAHSHGANVCFLLTRMGAKINSLITLGAPIRLEYPPDLNNVDKLYNIFSTGDWVQTPFGTFPNKRGEGRTLGDGKNLINIRVDDDGNGNNPGHSELHVPEVWNVNGLNDLLK